MSNLHLYKPAYDKYYYRLVYFANKIINDTAEARYIVVKSLTKFGLSTYKIESDDEIRSLLYTIVKNECLDFIGQRFKGCELPEEIVSDELIINNIIKSELLTELYEAINKLPPKRRGIAELFIKEELTNEEIAIKLGKGIDEIRSVKSKIIKQLKYIVTP